MLNKKLLFGLMAFALLLMISPNVSMASDDDDDDDLMYLRLGYKPTYTGAHIINKKVAKVVSDSVTVGSSDYKPEYEFNFYGASIGVGKYFSPETRIELEASANLIFNPSNDTYKNFSYENAGNNAYVNNGFSYMLASLNLYYDIDSGIDNIVPYVGAGVGLARVNFVSSSDNITYPVTMQIKTGVQTKINSKLPVYIGYTLSWLLKKEADEIKPILGSVNTKIISSYVLHSADIGFMLVQ